MHTRRHVVGLAAKSGLAVLAAALHGPARAQDRPIVLRMGSPLGPEDFTKQTADRFRNYVKDRTAGKIDVQLFFGNQLGDHATMAENIQMGALEMLNSFAPIWESAEPSFQVVNLPYVFDDVNHARRVFDGPVGKNYEAILLKRGVRVLSNFANAFRQTITTRPIRKLEDMKDLKLRSVTASTFLDTFKLLGANPVPISSKEVYMAMRSGLVEGVEAPLSILLGWKMNEVGRYVAMTNHMYNHAYFLINERVFQRLTPEQRTILTEGAREAAQWHYSMYEKIEADSAAELERLGVTITRPDLAPFRKAVEPIYAKYVNTPELKSLLEQVRSQR